MNNNPSHPQLNPHRTKEILTGELGRVMNSMAHTTVSGMRVSDCDSLIPIRGSWANIRIVSCMSWFGPVSLLQQNRSRIRIIPQVTKQLYPVLRCSQCQYPLDPLLAVPPRSLYTCKAGHLLVNSLIAFSEVVGCQRDGQYNPTKQEAQQDERSVVLVLGEEPFRECDAHSKRLRPIGVPILFVVFTR